MSVFLGEAAGARILRYGTGFVQIGDTYNLELETWPDRPAGPVGDVVFRTVDVLLRHKLGYQVEVTPIVDGVDAPPVVFSGGPPVGDEETIPLQAPVAQRGNGLAARVKTQAVLGETEIVNVSHSSAIIRQTP